MTDKTKETPAEAPRVTEEDLLKSLNELEAKKPDEAPAAEPTVEAGKLEKTAADVVKEADETTAGDLRKAIDASSAFSQFVGLMGQHVDSSLEELRKSVQGAADRDLAMIRILTDLKKSIDDNTAAVKAFGAQPGAPAAAAAVTVKTDEVLEKTAKDDKPALDPKAVRQSVLVGLERLAKTASDGGDAGLAQRIAHATAKFESTNQITDELLNKALATAEELRKAAVA